MGSLSSTCRIGWTRFSGSAIGLLSSATVASSSARSAGISTRRASSGRLSATTSKAARAAAGQWRTEPEVPLFSARGVRRGVAVKNVSFDVFRGEVLALGGLVGAGRTEVARLAFGADRLQGGHFEIEGKPVSIDNETKAIALGIALVPEERRSQGLMLEQSVGFNVNIASLEAFRSIAALPFLSSSQDAQSGAAARSRSSASRRLASRPGSQAFRAETSRRR